MNKLYKKVGLTAVPGTAFEEVKELYLVTVEDRHYDDQHELCTNVQLALKAANEKVSEWENEKGYEFEDENIDYPGWLFCKSAVGGNYAVTVRRVKVIE